MKIRCVWEHNNNDSIREVCSIRVLWEQFGQELLCREEAEKFDACFIQPMDQSDNTGVYNSTAIANKMK